MDGKSTGSKFSTGSETEQVTNILVAHLQRDGADVTKEDQRVGRADVAAWYADGRVVEYEVKRLRGDLNRELLAIEVVSECEGNGVSRYDRVRQLTYPGIANREMDRLIQRYCLGAAKGKYEKHEWYLDRSTARNRGTQVKPHEFYFVVSRRDASLTLRRLSGAPYGVLAIDPSMPEVVLLKRATPLLSLS